MSRKKMIIDEEEDMTEAYKASDALDEIEKSEFTEDRSISNPQAHLLYVKWAVKHLVTIDDCIRKISNFSNLNMMNILEAMWTERNKLVRENAAYADAQEIISSIPKE
jgi:hypothetical protein